MGRSRSPQRVRLRRKNRCGGNSTQGSFSSVRTRADSPGRTNPPGRKSLPLRHSSAELIDYFLVDFVFVFGKIIKMKRLFPHFIQLKKFEIQFPYFSDAQLVIIDGME